MYRKLYYNAVAFDGLDKNFGPNFICPNPKCERAFKDDRQGIVVPPNTTVKFNQQVTFKCMYCGAEIVLYVAATKLDKGDQGLQISVNPIAPDWFERDRAELTPG